VLIVGSRFLNSDGTPTCSKANCRYIYVNLDPTHMSEPRPAGLRIQADARAARSFLHACGAEYWALAKAGAVDPTHFTRVLSTVAWVVETATRIVDACYQAGGGSALYEKSPLQRRLRDIHTLTQHASVQENVFMTLGAERLGKAGSFSI